MAQISPTDWAQIISAVGAMTAAIVAVIAAIQSYRSAKQYNDTNEHMIRPRVVVYVENSLHNIAYLDLVILNEGGGLARDINLVVSGDEPSLRFSDNTDKPLSSLDAIKHGITVLPARSSRSYFMMSSDTKDDTKKILDLKNSINILNQFHLLILDDKQYIHLNQIQFHFSSFLQYLAFHFQNKVLFLPITHHFL